MGCCQTTRILLERRRRPVNTTRRTHDSYCDMLGESGMVSRAHLLRSSANGSTDGSIQIDYGCLRRDASGQPATTFHTRQITFPVLFTVYHTLEPHALDLVRLLPGPTAWETTPKAQNASTAGNSLAIDSLQRCSDGRHCLLGLSVRNVYGVPFEVSIARPVTNGPEDVAVTRLVPPGATERYVMFPNQSASD